ncbi:bifunctional DNA primase/polymerase [Streptomyces albidoflavus]|uniref:bifunctional DNA primase/polymerase n=1 Tax=Streptomyces albidoflavus TaxID=1886 RepID=UPI0037BC4FDF
MTPSTRSVARWCAAQGWAVHPLSPGTKLPPANCRRCSRPTPTRPNPQYIEHETTDCRCIETGGHCHGVRAATTDPARIDRWWSANPGFGVGVACGASGLVILDVDDHANADRPANGEYLPGVELHDSTGEGAFRSGWDTIAALCEARNASLPWLDPPTLTVLTAGGGLQAWFRVTEPEQWRPGAGRLGWQLDLRAGRSYGIAPGTVMASGAYQALGECRTVAPLPSWLEADLRRTGHYRKPEPSRQRPTARQLLATIQRPKGGAYVEAAVRAEVEQVADAATGTRNATLYSAARALGRFIPTGQLSESEVEACLLAAGATAGLYDAEMRSAIRSGVRAGINKGAAA